jgi:hypothetical protein
MGQDVATKRDVSKIEIMMVNMITPLIIAQDFIMKDKN